MKEPYPKSAFIVTLVSCQHLFTLHSECLFSHVFSNKNSSSRPSHNISTRTHETYIFLINFIVIILFAMPFKDFYGTSKKKKNEKNIWHEKTRGDYNREKEGEIIKERGKASSKINDLRIQRGKESLISFGVCTILFVFAHTHTKVAYSECVTLISPVIIIGKCCFSQQQLLQ